jgi:hypothetical protein
MLARACFFLTSIFLLLSCESIALMSTPAKKPKLSQTSMAIAAKKEFWQTLHQGDYQHLSKTTDLLTAAYLENTNDPDLAAYLGFAHIWKLTERERLSTIPPTIVDEIILAKKYFSDAVALNPQDARLHGFLGVSTLVTGKIFHDEREQVRGYFQLKRAIALWPEFNYFTAGYPMSVLDPTSKQYQEAIEWQWKTLDLCAETRIDRTHPDFSPYMKLETQKGTKRVCWNSWIAPHNFEGFFLNMGDMLVKQGNWQTGIQIYQNAKLSKTYSTWPYRNLLEQRIQQAEENVSNFQNNPERNPNKVILFNSGYGCVACHQG